MDINSVEIPEITERPAETNPPDARNWDKPLIFFQGDPVAQGTAPYQASQPMSGNKLTKPGAGAAAGDSASLGQIQSDVVAHGANMIVAPTVNVDGLGAKTIKKMGAHLIACHDILA